MKLRNLIIAASLLASPAFAADLPLQFKALNSPSTCLSAANCSGGYGTFGIFNDANLGGVLTGGANSGMGLAAGAGYQYWSGPIIAGIEVTGGYQFGTAGSTGSFTSTQFVKLGYNFFTSSQLGVASAPSATPAPSQNPFLNLVPANLLANSTPAVIAGGCLGHGIEKGCLGLEIDSVIAAGWSTAFQYYNAPSVRGLADENVFRIMVQRHF
jgi:hypothetical protein